MVLIRNPCAAEDLPVHEPVYHFVHKFLAAEIFDEVPSQMLVSKRQFPGLGFATQNNR